MRWSPAVQGVVQTSKLGVEPSRCIYVADGDDHEFDTAQQLGMETILVKYNLEDAYRHEPFPDAIPHVIEQFADLPAVVQDIEHEKNTEAS